MVPIKCHSAVSECGAVGCRSLKTCPILHPATAAAEFGNTGLDTWHVLHGLTPHLAPAACPSLLRKISILTYDMRHKLMWMLVPNECFASPSKMRWCDMNMRNQGMRPATKLQAATPWCQSPGWHVDSRGYLMENIWYSSQTHKKSRVAYKIH